MDAGEFVEKLDELNKLKNEGLISEEEYKKQVNNLSKQSNNTYGSNFNRNRNTVSTSSTVGTLIVLIIIIVACICFFQSNIFKEIKDEVVDAGKDLESIFDDNNYNKSGTTSSGTTSSGTSSSGTGSSGTSSSGTGSSGTSSSGTSSSGTSSSGTTESKSSYISKCKNYDSKYEDMVRDPNSYKGVRVKFRGMVEERWSKNGATCAFTLSACTSDNRHIGMLYCTMDSSVLNGKNLLQYDYINIYGEFKGLSENLYNIYGYVDYPHIEVKYIEFTSY